MTIFSPLCGEQAEGASRGDRDVAGRHVLPRGMSVNSSAKAKGRSNPPRARNCTSSRDFRIVTWHVQIQAHRLRFRRVKDAVEVNRELTWIWVDVGTPQLALPTHHRTFPTMFHSDSIANKTH